MPIVTVDAASRHLGESVTLQGWLYNRRSSGKILFLQVRDGTGVIQAVLSESDDADLFAMASELPRETSLRVRGTLREDARAPIGCELQLEGLEIVHRPTKDFPIELKEQTPAYLMDHRHLWIRTGRQIPLLRIRDTVFRAFRAFFHERGFVATEAPILTGTSVEGTTTLFELDYFGDRAYLGQSGQLYLEATAMALGKVYWLGPAFRAEKSKTRNHVTEFWIAEAEMAFVEHDENLKIQEDLVRYLVEATIAERSAELALLERDTELLKTQVAEPFPRIDYAEVIEWLRSEGHEIEFGSDLGAPHEEALSVRFGVPVFVERFPKTIKPFYMKRHPDNDGFVLGADLIGPEGYGELIGGSQREDDLDALVAHMEEAGLPTEPYQWYLDLRRYGSVPHSGFGMGLARVLRWICGVPHIREVIPFARQINRLYP
ncbi:MAG: asparagine--tRNA ligase [Candidatus Bipolaricaulota bacterium]|nr:MAG: asparagine--tRNA ligase [Candidatus Bipolaricaulota bacterium]